MTIYGPHQEQPARPISAKAQARKELLARIRRQRAQAYQALREKRRHPAPASEED